MKKFIAIPLALGLIAATTLSALAGPFAWDVRSTKDGNGQFRFGRESQDVSRVTVILQRNGNCEVRVFGRRETVLHGFWKGGRDGTAEVTINHGPEDATAEGVVRLDRDRRDFVSINLRGDTRRGQFNLNFSQFRNDYRSQPYRNRRDY